MPIARRSLLAAPVLLLARPARAETTWPERPVRFVVPFPAGSSPDIVARPVASHFAEVFGQPFVVENKPGAGGNIGTDAIAKATDGHTIGLTINGPVTTAPALYPHLPYDPAKDLLPVTLLARTAQFLVVHPGVPAQDLAGFIAYAKANPGKMSYGSVGAGSAGQLAMEDLKARAGIDLVHVPYRGFPQATLDLVAGRIEAMIVTAAGILPQIRDNKARPLAVTAEQRVPQAPNVPTLAEAGIPGAASYAWDGIFAPAGFPPALAERLAAESRRALAAPALREALDGLGFEVVASSPAEFRRFVAEETGRWGGLVRRLGIQAD